MSRKIMYCLALGVLLSLVVSVAAVAQLQASIATPDAGVRRTGAIQATNATVGLFNINVCQFGTDPATAKVYGGFKFEEVDGAGAKLNAVVTSQILSLDVTGNVATVKAVGFWDHNGTIMKAAIEMVALDQNPTGDNLRVVAKPLDSTLDIIYIRQGGVIRGDIVVFTKPVATEFAKGFGEIVVPRITTSNVPVMNHGKFAFDAKNTSLGTIGKIYYAEYDPRIMSIMWRPIVLINVPKVMSLEITMDASTGIPTATLKGPGTLNGQPVEVTVFGVDVVKPGTIPTALRDKFAIKAVAPDGTVYHQGGALIRGDIVIGPR